MLPMCPVWTLIRWWPERESNPRHEDYQWRVAKFPIQYQSVKILISLCATECAIELIFKLPLFFPD